MEKPASPPSSENAAPEQNPEKPRKTVYILEHTREGATPCPSELGWLYTTTGAAECQKCHNWSVIIRPK